MKDSLNLPNALALFRIALAPLMLWFLIDRDNSIFATWHPSWFDYFAGLIFVIASVTDFFDGFIAIKVKIFDRFIKYSNPAHNNHWLIYLLKHF